MDSATTKSGSGLLLAMRIMVICAVGVACLRLAWLSDDALITLRSALNFTHGWGPGFNATESVQAYTHPLWFLVWSGLGAATNQWILGVLAMGVVFTACSVGILAWSTRSIPRLFLAGILLILSNAFVEYSTSGLENPLSYLTVALLMALSLRSLPKGIPAWGFALITGLTIAALVLTRFDLVTLVAPIVLYAIVRFRRQWTLLALTAASSLVPLLIWFSWSKLTYDAWLPNTFEAKRNLNIPQSELVIQGIRYLWVSFEHDPVSLVAIAAGVLLALLSGSWIARWWVVGIALYVGYVIWVGGDFMAGRFLAVPLFAAVFLLAVIPLSGTEQVLSTASEPVKVTLAVALGILLAGGAALTGTTPTALASPTAPRWEVDQNLNAGVSDERGVYVANGRDLKGFIDKLSLAFVTPEFVPIGDGTGLNRELRELDREAKAWPTTSTYVGKPSDVGVFCGFLGTIGMATGPTVHLIDSCALTDRYLASIPYTPADPFAWKPGHFERQLPTGYEDAVRMNDSKLVEDPAQRFYLEQLWSGIRPQAVKWGLSA